MREKNFIENKKGLKLAAIVNRPDKAGRFPGVLLIPGFRGYKEEEQYKSLSKELSNRNIASVSFDPSGFGESEGSLEFDYRITNTISDAQDILNWLKLQDYIDIYHIGIVGESNGGFPAYKVSSDNTHVKCLVAVSTPNKFYDKGTSEEKDNRIDEWKANGFYEFNSSRFGSIQIPYDFYLDAQQYRAADYVYKLLCPKLFVIGRKDVNVLPEETKRIYDVAKGPKELWEVEGMDHYYKRDPELLEKVTKKIADFIEKNI